jgi:O-antigen/teichoic acid export membrane protein
METRAGARGATRRGKIANRGRRWAAAASQALPKGTLAIGAGLIIAGLAAYAFQILGFRALSKRDYAALNALWICVFVLVPGVFLPLEQEVGRAIAARHAQGLGSGPVIRRAGMLGLAFAIGLGLVVVAAAALVPGLIDVFAGNVGLIACLVIALLTFGFELLLRGVLAGHRRFEAYGLSMGAEGMIRLIPCVALAGAGVSNPVWYGLCLAIPPALAAAVAMYGQHGLVSPGPNGRWSELSTNLGYLLLGSFFAQILGYSPFLGAQALATTSQRGAVADFIVGLYLSRIPIVLFQAIQATLLPKLSGLVGAGRHDDFRKTVRTLVVVVTAIGALGVIGSLTVGPFVGKVLFGSKFHLGRLDLALLTAASGLFILALTLAQALIALLGHARATVGWLAGIVVFVAVTAVTGPNLFLRLEEGSIAGGATATVVMAAYVLNQLRGASDESLAALVGQIEYEPLEI